MNNNQLYHHGIKGMKWGVRRTDEQLARARGKKTEEIHEDYAKAHDGKSVKSMSDAELRARNNRLQMEQQYANLTKNTSAGKKFVTGVLISAGTAVATTFATKYMRAGVEFAEKKIKGAIKKG
jgi:hypothetical protein